MRIKKGKTKAEVDDLTKLVGGLQLDEKVDKKEEEEKKEIDKETKD